MSSPLTRRKFLISTAAAASSAWLLSACGGGSGDSGGSSSAAAAASQVPQADIDKAMEHRYHVDVLDLGSRHHQRGQALHDEVPEDEGRMSSTSARARPHYQKLRTAIQSGQGAPDVAQVEFQFINSFTLGDGNLLDLTPYAPSDISSKYPEWVWSQVHVNNGFWGVPQDTGPMGLLYRDDLLSAAGIQPPKTYDDFAAAAATYRTKNPKSYLVNVAPSQPGQIVAYLWQAGVRPFAFDGKQTVTIDLASDEAKKVVKFWGDLVTSGGASNDADFNDTWYQGLNSGKWATLPIAAWGPVFLAGSAPKTSGKWRAADLPQWDASKVASSNWGGSTDAVLKLSKNQIAASQLALFINTDKQSALQFATKQFLFPALNSRSWRIRPSSTRSRTSTAARR